MAIALMEIPNGSLVKLGENHKGVEFIKLEVGHYSDGVVTMLRKDAFAPAPLCAQSGDGEAPPNAYIGNRLDVFCDMIWPQMLDREIRANMIPLAIPVLEGFGSTNTHFIHRRGFALSASEVTGDAAGDGEQFSYFASLGQESWVANFDESTIRVKWGTRTPVKDEEVVFIDEDGTAQARPSYCNVFAPRPAFHLSGEITVTDEPDSSDGCFRVVSAPSSGGVFVRYSGNWVPAF